MTANNVFLLATCRKPELAPFTELVFKTLRTGFPNARITVCINGDCAKHCPNIKHVAELAQCIVIDEPETIHHKWIEELIETEREPFWICDTDMIFYSSVEEWEFDTALAGYLIPEFQDQFTGAITRSRLHTSLMYVNPVMVRDQLEKYEAQFPVTPFNPLANPYHPLCLPFNGRGYFYDTCSMLYHSIGGTSFASEHLNCYFHFFFGTLSDIVIPRLES